MKNSLRLIAKVAVLGLATSCAWEGAERAAAPRAADAAIRASFPPSARPQPQAGVCDGDACGIVLAEQSVAEGKCALGPSNANSLVILRQHAKGRPVTISWYIPVALQGSYRFGASDGIRFKNASQREFDKNKLVNAAEYEWRDLMTDRDTVFRYTVQVTRKDGLTCVFDPGLINDW